MFNISQAIRNSVAWVRIVRQSVEAAALVLGNINAVCRSSYIHPDILVAGESGELPALLKKALDNGGHCGTDELTVDECRFAALLGLASMALG